MNNFSIYKYSLPEIWSTLNKAEKTSVRNALRKKFECSAVTVWNWCKGNTIPPSVNDRKLIATIIRQQLGKDVSPEDLFPVKS